MSIFNGMALHMGRHRTKEMSMKQRLQGRDVMG